MEQTVSGAKAGRQDRAAHWRTCAVLLHDAGTNTDQDEQALRFGLVFLYNK